MLLIEIRHPTPFYDDSYAVNSANNGPYGDAIMYELIPEVEKRFRGIGQGWARFTYGGSTGGWEAMAVQMFYPEEFNGAWIACPDPIDFRAYTVDRPLPGPERLLRRQPVEADPAPGPAQLPGPDLGHRRGDPTTASSPSARKGRSGDQWDIWQAVYSPVGAGRLPEADLRQAHRARSTTMSPTYWREHFDLGYILRRDWKTLGPKVRGKLKIYVGDMDNYYLNNAVYLVEDFLKSVNDPPADAEVDYGDRAEHCWNGDHTRPNAYSRQPVPPDVHSPDHGPDPAEPPAGCGHGLVAILNVRGGGRSER